MSRIAISTLLILMSVRPAPASLLIAIGNTSVTPSGTGTVDVLISSDGLTGDELSSVGFEFRVTTAGPRRLDFVDPQNDLQLVDPNYIFAGDSLAATFPPVSLVNTTIVPNDTIIGGDATFSGSEIIVGTTSLLLARLELTAITDLPPIVGDTFNIELVPSVLTFFQDNAFNDVLFSSTPGVVSIVVPEPSSKYLLMTGLITAFCLLICRHWSPSK